jgi:hypothetical protein
MCLATTLSLLSLCDGDGIAFLVTKVANSNEGKLEVTTTGCDNNNM